MITFLFRNIVSQDCEIELWPQYEDIITVDPQKISIKPSKGNYTVTVRAMGAGHSELTANTTDTLTK